MVAAYQDCEPVPGDDDMFIMPGTWENLGNSGWGVSISHNKGKDFDHYDWGFDTEPRYASFADTNVSFNALLVTLTLGLGWLDFWRLLARRFP